MQLSEMHGQEGLTELPIEGLELDYQYRVSWFETAT